MTRPLVTAEELRQLLHYDPLTGDFTWRVTRGRSAKAGALAGHDCGVRSEKRRVVIGLNGRLYRAGRLAWLYMTGQWPETLVDHKDGDYRNHRWLNLRDVDNTTNVENQRRAARSNKSSGLLGVTWNKERGAWQAQIKVKRKTTVLGFDQDPHKAQRLYIEAKRRLHAGCTI